jgi:hypothetical protein
MWFKEVPTNNWKCQHNLTIKWVSPQIIRGVTQRTKVSSIKHHEGDLKSSQIVRGVRTKEFNQ